MNKTRLETFSDAVIAIILTIMVLELKIPHSTDIGTLMPLVPVFLSYVLSFIYIAIYWNNHHHLIQAARHVNGGVLWANMHLLFWLSLIPFASGWLGENHFTPLPTALYGFVLFMCSVAYFILQQALKCTEKENSLIAVAVGRDIKGKASCVLYVVAILVAFYHPAVSLAIYGGVASWWLIPDRRIAGVLTKHPHQE